MRMLFIISIFLVLKISTCNLVTGNCGVLATYIDNETVRITTLLRGRYGVNFVSIHNEFYEYSYIYYRIKQALQFRRVGSLPNLTYISEAKIFENFLFSSEDTNFY